MREGEGRPRLGLLHAEGEGAGLGCMKEGGGLQV